MIWNVYRFTRHKVPGPRDMELIGTVEAEHQPAAWRVAAERWPDLARAVWPKYQNGRLVLRPAGES